eukprot:6407874-Karenia_brevis.AAC.1
MSLARDGPENAGKEVALLGPGSRVYDIRARLIELNQPIYGRKQEPWERLEKAEAAREVVLA